MLVHDTFSWGSRRFDLSQPTPRLEGLLEAYAALWRERGLTPSADERFDLASSLHEDTLAKAAGALGQTFAGAVLSDDLVALDVLAGLDGVDPDRLSTFGFSGGGCRSLLLAALDDRVGTCVVACMMATFDSLVPWMLDSHSWLLNVPGLWSFSDWPDLTRFARARFLVQYRLDDPLFPPAGMSGGARASRGDPRRHRSTTAARSWPAGTLSTRRCRTRRRPSCWLPTELIAKVLHLDKRRRGRLISGKALTSSAAVRVL